MSKKEFFHPSITVDITIFTIVDGDLKVVTITRAHEPFKGMNALPGGFLHENETTLDAAKRVLKTKVGLQNIYLEQLYTFDALNRDPRGPVLSVAYFALIPKTDLAIIESTETEQPVLSSTKGLKNLAFDHIDILKYAQERLKGKLEYTNIAFSLLPDKFTFAELQGVYETVFTKDFDRRNFRKKIMRLKLVKATTEKVKKGRQRPALLYKAATKKKQSFKDTF